MRSCQGKQRIGKPCKALLLDWRCLSGLELALHTVVRVLELLSVGGKLVSL